MRLEIEHPQENLSTESLKRRPTTYLPTGLFSLVLGTSKDKKTSTLVANVRGLLKEKQTSIPQSRPVSIRNVHMNQEVGSQQFLEQLHEPYSMQEIRGTFPEKFCQWAEEQEADVIAVGSPSIADPITGNSYWWLRQMIQKTNLPLLIVPDGFSAPYLESDTIRVQISDNLSQGGMMAIQALTELGSVSKPIKIFHVYVQEFSALSNPKSRYDEMDCGMSRESIHEQLYIRSALLRNSLPNLLLEYEAHVLLGNVSEELLRFSESRRIDIIACGRPCALSHKQMQSGNRIPKHFVTHNAVTFIAPEYLGLALPVVAFH